MSCKTEWEKGGCYQFSDLNPKERWFKDLAHSPVLLNLVCSQHSFTLSRSLHSVKQGTSRSNPSILSIFFKRRFDSGPQSPDSFGEEMEVVNAIVNLYPLACPIFPEPRHWRTLHFPIYINKSKAALR